MVAGKTGEEPGWYRLAYNLASLFLFLYVMAAYRNSSVLYFVPGTWSLVMYLTQLALAGILYSCVSQTGVADFLGLHPRSQRQSATKLVTSGWYRHTRHPLYFFSLLFMIFNPVMTTQWLILTICSLTYFIIGALVEEKRLTEKFGDEYRRYQQTTPFLLPGFGQSPIRKRSA